MDKSDDIQAGPRAEASYLVGDPVVNWRGSLSLETSQVHAVP